MRIPANPHRMTSNPIADGGDTLGRCKSGQSEIFVLVKMVCEERSMLLRLPIDFVGQLEGPAQQLDVFRVQKLVMCGGAEKRRVRSADRQSRRRGRDWSLPGCRKAEQSRMDLRACLSRIEMGQRA